MSQPLRSAASAHNQVTHSNEWVEGTQIEPSVTYGSQYLDLTRQFAAQFKSGAPPVSIIPASAIQPAVASVTAAPTATLATDQVRTTDVLRVRDGPGLDREILGRLRADQVIQVLGRSEDGQWLEIAYPDGETRGWVSAEFVAPRGGLDQFPVKAAPSTPTPMPTATLTPSPTASPSLSDSPAPPLDVENLPDWY